MKAGRVALVALGAYFLATVAAASPRSGAPPTVGTTCGPVAGYTAGDGNVNVYSGIPYAAPPTGALRFAPTVDAKKGAAGCWSGTLNATAPPPVCMQAAGPNATVGVEDCLLLTVTTPTKAPPKEGYPVFVFIHGGNLMEGGAAVYDFTNFTRSHGVVAVAVQYRLGPFGFMALSELSAVDPRGVSGNFGFLDQQSALRWVQANAASFGGNTHNVTVFGQSSGGTSVLALLSSPASNGLFSAAISLSGSPNITMSLSTAEANNAAFVSNAGCAGLADANATVACLRALNGTAVLAAQPSSWVTGLAGEFGLPADPSGQHFPGLAIVDGHTVAMPVIDALKRAVVDVPTILQSLAEEPDFLPVQNFYNSTVSSFRTYLAGRMARFGPSFSEEVLINYVEPLAVNPQKAYDQISADIQLTCGTAALGVAAGIGFRSNVYLGYVQQGPAQPFATLAGNVAHYAFHTWDLIAAAELWSLAHDFGGSPPYSPLSADVELGRTIAGSWLYLGVTGSLPHTMGWNPVSSASGFPGKAATGVIGSKVVTSTSNKAATCAWWRAHGVGQSFWWSD